MFFEDKRRITEQTLTYWNRLRGQRKWPDAKEVKAAGAADIWDDLFIVKVTAEDDRLKYSYVYQGRSIKGIFESAQAVLQEGLDKKYETVYRGKDYLQDEEIYTNRQGFRIKYRMILLPLGPDDATIDHLLGGMRYRSEEGAGSL